MIRLIFSSIMVFHSLLHLIAFAREWDLGAHGALARKTIFQFTGNSSRVAGLFWLLAGSLFLMAAFLYLIRKDWYWIPAAAALIVSQTLITIYWQDARYGTMVNVVLFIVVIFAAAASHFDSKVKSEVTHLKAQAAPGNKVLTEEMIANKPQIVQRWLRQAGVVGKENPNVVRIEQKGSMRSSADGKWMPLNAVQYFSIDPPSFIWHAEIEAAPLIYIAGRDKFSDGEGNMLIKLLSVLPLANSSGKEINQGTLLRYMAEMAWFPQAAASDYLTWEPINDRQARVTMTYRGTSASGTYFFNEGGDVTGFEARRYGDFGGVYRKETWSIAVTGYASLNGRRIGNTSEVTWKLPEGDFKWLKVELTAID